MQVKRGFQVLTTQIVKLTPSLRKYSPHTHSKVYGYVCTDEYKKNEFEALHCFSAENLKQWQIFVFCISLFIRD